MHRPRLFRRFHRRHHKQQHPSPFTAYSFDLREALLMVFFFSLIWSRCSRRPGRSVACSSSTRSAATPCCTAVMS